MKGAVFLGDSIAEIREFPEPEAGPGEVIVAVRASGLCGSDLHYYRGPGGRPNTSGTCIVGHEPAGVVHSVGLGVDPAVVSIGDRVMIHHYIGCGSCDNCRTGWTQMCARGTRVFGAHEHGGHAPYMRVPAATLVPLPDTLSFEAGAAIGCGTGTAWGGLERLGELGGNTIAIFGQGPVGLSGTMLAHAKGARVIAIDPVAGRREHAKRLGAFATIDPTAGDAAAQLNELTDGAGISLALETSGSTAATNDLLASIAQWGKACFVGLGGKVEFEVRNFHIKQITLMTSWSMSIVQMRQCADFIARNNLPIDELFSDRWAIDDVVEAYKEFAKQEGGKGVILFGAD